MSKTENEISKYIDSLNREKKPAYSKSDEFSKLAETVNKIRTLKKPAMPGPDFPQKIVQRVIKKNNKTPIPKHTWIAGAAAAAALVIMTFLISPQLSNKNIVYAMEKAFQDIYAYHGVIEITETNLDGIETLQGKREVWADKKGRYYVKELQGYGEGRITVNNGRQKWQLLPLEKQSVIFPSFPDPYRFTLELAGELADVKNAEKYHVIGEETVSGRTCSILEVTPKGGIPYKIWVDKETDLPLQKQSAMQNALQYKITYSEIDFIDELPPEIMVYTLPDGFSQKDDNPEQYVSTTEEARRVAGFLPDLPKEIPGGYKRYAVSVETGNQTIKTYFESGNNSIIIMQGKAGSEFKPSSSSVLGAVGKNPAEIMLPTQKGEGLLQHISAADINAVRWQEKGFEYCILGNTPIEELKLFVTALSGERLQMQDKIEEFNPQVNVKFDLGTEENEQKNVDAGHSSWRLDPVYVTQVFASLKLYPDGIVGEYPIQYNEIKILKNTGTNAVAEITSDISPVKTVYLKKLIRQDQSGIWTVIGYDPN